MRDILAQTVKFAIKHLFFGKIWLKMVRFEQFGKKT